MNSRLTCISIEKGEIAVSLGDAYAAFTTLVDLTVVGVMAAASVNDAGLTVDINDDGAATGLAALACATAATPGTWKTTHLGGTNAPFSIAAGSVVTLDANAAAANTRINVQLWALIDE